MKRSEPKLSVIVIAKNEEARIAKCLDALGFADEVIVIDNASFDKTAQIARDHNAAVYTYRSEGFSTLRNAASDLARYEWMLFVDADEVITEELGREIEKTIAQAGGSDTSGYELFRKNFYLGKPWPGGEWMLRLFRKKAFRKWQGELHETPIIDGATGRLKGHILHDTHRTLTEMVAKTNEWSYTEARLRFDAHHPEVSWWRIFRVMATAFWQSYIVSGGWRAGTVGLIESIYQGFSMFITYAKLWEMQKNR